MNELMNGMNVIDTVSFFLIGDFQMPVPLQEWILVIFNGLSACLGN